jgi:hypothetical protein
MKTTQFRLVDAEINKGDLVQASPSLLRSIGVIGELVWAFQNETKMMTHCGVS